MDKVYNKLDRNGFQLNKINNALKRGLNYRVLQDPIVRTTLFQPQLLSIQTTTLLPGGTLAGPLLNATPDPQTVYPQPIYPQTIDPQTLNPQAIDPQVTDPQPT